MILLFLMLHISAVYSCGRFFFIGEKNVALFGHVIKNITTHRQVACVLECLETSQCMSINKHENKAGQFTCELSKSSRDASPQDLKARPGFVYLQTIFALDDCTDEICQHKRALPDGWFQFGSKLYKVFSERKTWEQANQVCQADGGKLVTIENERENKFVFEMFAKDKTNAREADPYSVIAHWKLDGTDTDITLFSGANYQQEDGKDHLYLNSQTGAYATTPARHFRDGSFTIASWVKLLDPVSPQSSIYSFWPLVNNQFLFMTYYGKISFAAVNTDGGFHPLFNAGTHPISTWFNAAVVWDRTTNEVYLFLNGTEVGSQSVQANLYLADVSPSVHHIGLKQDFGETLNGYLGDLMVFDEALNEGDIKRISDDYQKDRGVWIGLNDVTGTGLYQWSDSTSLVYSNWASGQPDRRYNNQDCVTIMDDDFGHWEDINCGHQLPFICQKNA